MKIILRLHETFLKSRKFSLFFLTKLTFSLIVLLLLSTPVSGATQEKISIDAKNVSLKEVFESIKKQSGYSFWFRDNEVDGNRLISISVKNKKLTEVLNLVLTPENLAYRIENKHIVIYQKKVESSAVSVSKKKHLFNGVVYDENGQPVIGASIQEKGNNTNGTITDMDGAFSINAPEESVVKISYVGYTSQEINLKGDRQQIIRLKPDARSLEEVVVVGYGTMKKSDVNAAIVSIKAEELDITANTSISQMLSGKAAGLTIMENSSQPGAGATILIRGEASVGAGNDPLYVIDGFPISNSSIEPGSGTRYSMGSRSILNSINPNDIESIEILKDASATAVYGARGCNGVILITTKRGKGNHLQVEYTGSYSVQQIAKRPDMLNAQELKIETNRYLEEEYMMRYKIAPYGTRDPSTVPAFIPRFDSDEIAVTGPGTDWYKEIMQTGRVTQHNLSVNSGSERTKLMVSFNYFGQEGVIKTSGLDRFSGRLNLDHRMYKWLDFGISLTGSVIKNRNAAIGGATNENSGIIQSALQYNPSIKPERDENGEYLLNPDQALIPNPLSFLDITDKTTDKRWLLNSFLNFTLTEHAKIRISAGFDDQRGNRKSYLPKTFMYGKGSNGVANINDVSKTDYLFEGVFNYNRTFKKIHGISGMLGYSFQQFNTENMGMGNYDFFTDALLFNKMSVGEGVATVDSYRGKSALASYFGRVQYNLNNRYLFTFTARVDGSDKFGANNKYGFFPSGAFAWRVSQEDFMSEQTVLSDLKIRLSAGQTGNSNIGNNAYEYYAADGRNYVFGDKEYKGVSLSQLANPNLKWETTTEYNFGIDYGFLNNRISGNFELYYKQIKDLLGSRRLMSNSIVGSVPANLGKTQSKGLEFSLFTKNIVRPFTWNSTLTITTYRDSWLERSPDVILSPFESDKDPIRAVYAFIPDGIIQPGEVVPHMPQASPGMMKIKDISGLDANGRLDGKPDGSIDVADMVMIGSNAPKITFGFDNRFEYKGFDLGFFIYGSAGATRWSHVNAAYGTAYEILKIKTGNNYLTDIKDRWAHDNQTSTMPSGLRNPYLLDGHYAHEKIFYIRLKNISLGYEFTNSVIKSPVFKKARLSFDIQNLFTITNFSGIDPEVENDSAPYPLQRTFSISASLTF